MTSIWIFIIPIIIVLILLFITAISAAVGASDLFSSPFYATEDKLKTAHTQLAWAAGIGIFTILVLIIVLAVYFFSKSYYGVVSDISSVNVSLPTMADLSNAVLLGQQLESEISKGIWLLIFLVISVLLTLIIGLLCAFAAGNINSSPSKDSRTDSAYSAAIIGSLSGIFCIFLVLISVFAFLYVRSSMYSDLAKTKQIQVNINNPIVTQASTVSPQSTVFVPAPAVQTVQVTGTSAQVYTSSDINAKMLDLQQQMQQLQNAQAILNN